MPSLASATIIGHLGADPEVKESRNGKSFAKCRVAVSRKGRDEKVTDWYGVTVFGLEAEWLSRDAHKGSLVVASGRLEIDVWTDRDGNERTTPCIVANSCRCLDPREKPARQHKDSEWDAAANAKVDDGELPF